MPCNLRIAEEPDLPALETLINTAFEVERSFKLEPRLDPEHTREYFRKGRFLLAEDEAGLAGCVYVELDGDRAYLGLLSVDPSRQKSGLGRRLTNAAEDFARANGAHRMELTVVNLRTELPPFYRKLGYVVVGEEPMPEEWARRINRPCHFIRMARSLSTTETIRTETMNLRFADEPDLPALMALINKAFIVETFFIRGDRLDEQRTREYFEKGRFLLAENSGALAGAVYVELRGDRSYLGLLSVDPSRQKTGLGRRLTAAAEEFAREMGSRHMDLTVVNRRTELPPFYEKLGYTVVGTEPIREDMIPRLLEPCHFIKMTKPLGNG